VYNTEYLRAVNWIDLLLAGVLLTGLVRGLLHGFVYEIAHLGAYFLGWYAGFKLADSLAPKIGKLLEADPMIVHHVSFFLVFIAVWIGVVLMGRLFEGLVSVAFLGIFNKVAGALFGLAKYLVVCGILLYFFHKADTKYGWISPDTKAASRLYYPVLKTSTSLMPVLENATGEN
jgi:membrane protein required for colicin V production